MELENRALQYDELDGDEADQTIDEADGEGNEGDEESKFQGLSGEFNRRSDSQVEIDGDNSNAPLMEGELSGLNGEGSMIGTGAEEEYAEIDTSKYDNICEVDTCKFT